MDFSKIKKIGFILFILFILLFPFWCVKGLCSTEINGIVLNGVANTDGQVGDTVTLISNSYAKGIYFPVRAGYTYQLEFSANPIQTYRAFISENTPAVDVEALVLYRGYFTDGIYTFTATEDGFLFFWNLSDELTNSNTKFNLLDDDMNSAVNNLVDNVGISQIWDIFDISINYIVVVVLVAFGVYIIFLVIRKISRGKEGL